MFFIGWFCLSEVIALIGFKRGSFFYNQGNSWIISSSFHCLHEDVGRNELSRLLQNRQIEKYLKIHLKLQRRDPHVKRKHVCWCTDMFLFSLETKLAISPRMTLNSWASCPYLPQDRNSLTTVASLWVGESNPSPFTCSVNSVPTELHLQPQIHMFYTISIFKQNFHCCFYPLVIKRTVLVSY